MEHGRYRPSQHDSGLTTPIDLPCTPEVPGTHLPWTCAATGQGPATTPTHPILVDMEVIVRLHDQALCDPKGAADRGARASIDRNTAWLT